MRSHLQKFIHTESSSGLILLLCTLLALFFANTPLSTTYHNLLHASLGPLTIHHWINDGLMSIFFFMVGLEIKKELISGELRTLRQAALPVAAALGGMVVPALIYWIFNLHTPYQNGWAIPMATDIAFALGVLTVFGSRAPAALKIFLLALAIVDDLGAVLVIALFFTQKIQWAGLLLALLAFTAVWLVQKKRVGSYWVYLLLGAVAWTAVFYSGIHATVAGVILGLMTPLSFNGTNKNFSPLNDLISKLHPWVSFGIMPLFALANAGLSFANINSASLTHPITTGVFVGLLVGKPIGILLFSFLAVKLKWTVFPAALTWRQLTGVACLGGVGFTMALFISQLALKPADAPFATLGIFAASVAAAVLGAVLLKTSRPSAHASLTS